MCGSYAVQFSHAREVTEVNPLLFYLGGRHVGRRLSDQQALTSQDLESRSRSCSEKRARIMYSMADTRPEINREGNTWMGQLTV